MIVYLSQGLFRGWPHQLFNVRRSVRAMCSGFGFGGYGLGAFGVPLVEGFWVLDLGLGSRDVFTEIPWRVCQD